MALEIYLRMIYAQHVHIYDRFFRNKMTTSFTFNGKSGSVDVPADKSLFGIAKLTGGDCITCLPLNWCN